MKSKHLLFHLAAAALSIGLYAGPVPLQNPTASFSQQQAGNFFIANTLLPQDPFNIGWAIYDGPPGPPFGPPYLPSGTLAQTAVFETVQDVGFTNETTLTFTLSQLLAGAPQHTIGRLRLSATTEPRNTFADGLSTGGNLGTNWVVLEPAAYATESGCTVALLPDQSLLYGGLLPNNDIYFIRAYTSLTNITGFRLEVLTDPSLPGGDGPGRQPDNGNFVLTGFEVSALPGRITNSFASTAVSVIANPAVSTETTSVPVRVNATGFENSIAFSLSYETNRLTFSGITAPPGLSNLVVTLDTNELSGGRVGVTAALPAGTTLPSGLVEIVQLQFATASSPGDFQTPVQFVSTPTPSRILDASGNELSSKWAGTSLFVAGTQKFPELRLPAFNAFAGTQIEIPVTFVSHGIENALSFTLNYGVSAATYVGVVPNPAFTNLQVLSNTNSIRLGRVGVVAALPSGQSFAAGTNELCRILIKLPISTGGPQAFSLRFAETPTPQEVVDITALPLESRWLNGSLGLLPTELEGDVHPRSTPNRAINVSDWVQAGRFVAGLDDAASGSEFQRVDCAPLETAGNGLLTVSDWVQAGRFTVSLDPFAVLGGPDKPSTNGPSRRNPAPSLETDRSISFSADELVRGKTNEILVQFNALGDENALAFSVSFNPAELRFVDGNVGPVAAATTWNLNARQASAGRVGIAMAMTAGNRFAKTSGPIAKLRFVATGSGGASVGFIDGPVIREVANASAQTLEAAWVNTTVPIAQPSLAFALDPSDPANPIVLSWAEKFSDAQLRTADRINPDSWQNVPASPVLSDGRYRVRLPATASESFFRLDQP